MESNHFPDLFPGPDHIDNSNRPGDKAKQEQANSDSVFHAHSIA